MVPSMPYTVGLEGFMAMSMMFIVVFLAQLSPAGLVVWLLRKYSPWLRFSLATLAVVASSFALSLYLVSTLNPTLPLMIKSAE